MSACLIWICVPTLAVLLIFYSLTDVSKPDVDGVIASTIWSTNTLGARAAPTLQLVFIFTRHGSRGPTFTYPSCPYHPLNTNHWPNGWMALTARGHVQMYKLGLKFRSLYNGFLDRIYHPKDFQANSTLFARTMISAGQFLAGLFPSHGYQLWNKYLPWQPVPVYPTYKDYQKIAYALLTTKCPRFHEAWNKSVAKFFLKYRKNITDLLEYAKPFTKIEFDESFNDTESSWMTMYTMWESFFPIAKDKSFQSACIFIIIIIIIVRRFRSHGSSYTASSTLVYRSRSPLHPPVFSVVPFSLCLSTLGPPIFLSVFLLVFFLLPPSPVLF
ncbi:hypothetical protein J6590_023464 [Homalodisca vitripennis]|nr:hypothetical protein J6590_023464 [Homalodisca vitripennis]